MQGQTTRPEAVPAALSSPRAKLVYLYLTTHGESTVGELSAGLAMQKITLYSILKTLKKEGLVVGGDGGYSPA